MKNDTVNMCKLSESPPKKKPRVSKFVQEVKPLTDSSNHQIALPGGPSSAPETG